MASAGRGGGCQQSLMRFLLVGCDVLHDASRTPHRPVNISMAYNCLRDAGVAAERISVIANPNTQRRLDGQEKAYEERLQREKGARGQIEWVPGGCNELFIDSLRARGGDRLFFAVVRTLPSAHLLARHMRSRRKVRRWHCRGRKW